MDYGHYLLQAQDRVGFREHWAGFGKIEPHHWMLFGCEDPNCERPDFAWRVYLSLILKPIHEKTARIELLKEFYIEYNDALHK
jgi:hypothetical protein